MSLDERAALVSGAGSGIGRAITLALADRGVAVIAADVDLDGAQETVDQAMTRGGRAIPQQCEVTSSVDLAAAFDRAVEEFGRLDIVCNNAGIGGDNAWLTDDTSDWRRVIEVDLVAGLYPMAAAPIYGAAKAGVINSPSTAAVSRSSSSGECIEAFCQVTSGYADLREGKLIALSDSASLAP
jgi:NAD(P)-dependent dehydrogenase (short-subunit alcohol dehydrogenase family)